MTMKKNEKQLEAEAILYGILKAILPETQIVLERDTCSRYSYKFEEFKFFIKIGERSWFVRFDLSPVFTDRDTFTTALTVEINCNGTPIASTPLTSKFYHYIRGLFQSEYEKQHERLRLYYLQTIDISA